MRIEVNIPERHYNNIMAIDSMSLGRAPYKGIIMYAINAIKHGRVLKQEPTTENDLGDDCISRAEAIKCLECDFDITGKENMKTVVNYINSAHDKIVNLPRVKQEPFKPMVEIDLDYVIKQKYIERDVLDKIRAEITICLKALDEIEKSGLNIYLPNEISGRRLTYQQCLEFIDKYKAETEEI